MIMKDATTLGAVAGAMSWPEKIMQLCSGTRKVCRERRGAVLKHPDLAAKLCRYPLSFERPDQWNGNLPPAVALIDDGGGLRSMGAVSGREVRVRFSQTGRSSTGNIVNLSPRREALIAISTEAWRREHGARISAPAEPDCGWCTGTCTCGEPDATPVSTVPEVDPLPSDSVVRDAAEWERREKWIKWNGGTPLPVAEPAASQAPTGTGG